MQKLSKPKRWSIYKLFRFFGPTKEVTAPIVLSKDINLYNNDFNKWLDKSNESIDDTFKVYMSDSERNGSFFDQTIGSSHF